MLCNRGDSQLLCNELITHCMFGAKIPETPSEVHFFYKEIGYTDCTANALCNIELYRDTLPISGQIDRAYVIKTLDLVSISCQVKRL